MLYSSRPGAAPALHGRLPEGQGGARRGIPLVAMVHDPARWMSKPAPSAAAARRTRSCSTDSPEAGIGAPPAAGCARPLASITAGMSGPQPGGSEQQGRRRRRRTCGTCREAAAGGREIQGERRPPSGRPPGQRSPALPWRAMPASSPLSRPRRGLCAPHHGGVQPQLRKLRQDAQQAQAHAPAGPDDDQRSEPGLRQRSRRALEEALHTLQEALLPRRVAVAVLRAATRPGAAAARAAQPRA